tara:strand:- start:954 stop:2222 length:1269 start_codon:yes stop_codon:yes gene_type:complete
MAVIVGQTREELRKSIGHNLGAIRLGTMTGSGSTSTGVDAEMPNADDHENGNHIVFTSGTNDGAIRIQTSYVGSSTTFTTRGDVLAASTADGDTYESWDEDMPPARVHDMIDRAVRTITRKGAPPSTDISLHTYRDRRNYEFPTAFVGLQHLNYRSSYTWTSIHNCNTVFDELVDADVTASADGEDYASGNSANKFVLAAGLGATDIIASDSISSLDLSGYDTVEFWIKSTVALTAGQLRLRLSADPSAAATTEDLDIPATSAGTWTRHQVALANPQSDTAIISVGLIHTSDIGAATVWLDEVRAFVEDSSIWSRVSRANYTRDKDRRELVLNETAYSQTRYSLLKMEGYKKPTALTSDSSICDVEPEYLIMRTTAWLMRARGNRYAGRREADWLEAERLEGLAELWMSRQRLPQGTIWVDD